MLINSYAEQLDTSTKHFDAYLNNEPTPLVLIDMVNGIPYIPTITNDATFYVCGLVDDGEVTEGSHVDISHLQIYTPTGGMYEEPDGNEL